MSASLSLHLGHLTLMNMLDTKFWCSLSHRRGTIASFDSNLSIAGRTGLEKIRMQTTSILWCPNKRALKQRGRILEWQCYNTIQTTTAVQWKRHLIPRRAKSIRTVLREKIEKERFFLIGSRCRRNFTNLSCRLRQRIMLKFVPNICRKIVYPYLTNQIPVLWSCHCGCHGFA